MIALDAAEAQAPESCGTNVSQMLVKQAIWHVSALCALQFWVGSEQGDLPSWPLPLGFHTTGMPLSRDSPIMALMCGLSSGENFYRPVRLKKNLRQVTSSETKPQVRLIWARSYRQYPEGRLPWRATGMSRDISPRLCMHMAEPKPQKEWVGTFDLPALSP